MSDDASGKGADAVPPPSGSKNTPALKFNAPEFVPGPPAPAKPSGNQGQKQQKKAAIHNAGSAKAKPVNPPSGGPKLTTASVNAPAFTPSGAGNKPAQNPPANPKMSVSAASFVPKAGPPSAPAAPPPSRPADSRQHEPQQPQGMISTAADQRHAPFKALTSPPAAAGHTNHHTSGYSRSNQNHPNRKFGPHPHQQQHPSGPAPYRGGPGGGGRGRGRDGGRSGGRGSYGLGTPQGIHGYHMLGPGRVQLSSRFASEQLRQQLQQRSYLCQAQWVGEGEEAGVPEKIQMYHSIYPLDEGPPGEERVSGTFGVRTSVYKGVSSHDGVAYCLRHVDGRQVVPSSELVAAARGACEAWGQVQGHPNVVALRGTFLCDELPGGQSLFFVHDFYPGAVTMAQAHMQATATSTGLVRNAATEEQLWSYLVQLCEAVSAVHGCGLSIRPGGLSPTKVLLTGFGRIRVGSCGVLDVLRVAGAPKEREEDLHLLQIQDLAGIGQLVLTLACSMGHGPPSMDYLSAHYSQDLTHTVGALLAAGEGRGAVTGCHELRQMLGERAFSELYSQQSYMDNMVTELTKEVENGRLLRLLIKLGFINERPDGLFGDAEWAETGDRYLLKLFRDFVFHQTSEDAAPLLDWGHVLEALNKLDAGVPEKVLLLGRDEQSLLVASYADLKRCVESSFGELKSAAQAARHAAAGGRRPGGPHDYTHDAH